MLYSDLESKVLQLHEIARAVEKNFGISELSKAIRAAADRLHEMLNVTF
jgi:hypothetical protein